MNFHHNTTTSLHLRQGDENHPLNLDLLLEPSSSSLLLPPAASANNSSSSSASMEPRVFSCNYCQRKFYSSQALGGHQNAHKLERTLAKKSRELSSSSSPMHAHGVVMAEQQQPSPTFSSHYHHHRSIGVIDNQGQIAGSGGREFGGGYASSKQGVVMMSSWSRGYASENVHQEDITKLDLSLRL